MVEPPVRAEPHQASELMMRRAARTPEFLDCAACVRHHVDTSPEFVICLLLSVPRITAMHKEWYACNGWKKGTCSQLAQREIATFLNSRSMSLSAHVRNTIYPRVEFSGEEV